LIPRALQLLDLNLVAARGFVLCQRSAAKQQSGEGCQYEAFHSVRLLLTGFTTSSGQILARTRRPQTSRFSPCVLKGSCIRHFPLFPHPVSIQHHETPQLQSPLCLTHSSLCIPGGDTHHSSPSAHTARFTVHLRLTIWRLFTEHGAPDTTHETPLTAAPMKPTSLPCRHTPCTRYPVSAPFPRTLLNHYGGVCA